LWKKELRSGKLVKCVKLMMLMMRLANHVSVKTATKELAMGQRVVTLATPVLTVAVMMKEDGLPEIDQSRGG
jgi:hypothetical protein